jgi:hypothetical protein
VNPKPPASLSAGVPSTQAITGCAGNNKYHHCYAEGEMGQAWTGNFVAINAIGGDLHITCLNPLNAYTDFANYETWLDTDLNNAPINAYWVEGGAKDGIGSSGAYEGFQWFWADNRPNGGGYNEHYLGGASLGTYENVSFRWQGGGNWNVYFAGTYEGTSAHVGDYAGGSQTGMETTTQSVYFQGYTRWWQYADNHWNWHPVDNAGYGEYVDGPLSVNGYVTNDRPGDDVTEKGTNSNSCQIAAAQRPQAFRGVAGLAALARLAARANGDPTPARVRYVRTTWGKIAWLTGGRATRSGPAYVLQLHGRFTGADASVPRGAPLPAGTTLTIAIDAATGTVTDTSLTRSSPSITTLGTTHPLSLPVAHAYSGPAG